MLMPTVGQAAIGGKLTANLTMISRVANAHIDEFNGPTDQLEVRDGELLAQAALVQLRQQVAEAEQRITTARQARRCRSSWQKSSGPARPGTTSRPNTAPCNTAPASFERHRPTSTPWDPAGAGNVPHRGQKNRALRSGKRTAIAANKSNEAAYRAEVVLKLELPHQRPAGCHQRAGSIELKAANGVINGA